MKKALPVLVVLAILAASVFFFMKRRGDAPEFDLKPGRAAELAPADAIFFAEVVDFPRTSERWKGTALHAIEQEPEWKEFTAKWNDFKEANEQLKAVFDVYADVEKADPAGMWIAMTAIEPSPKVVAGFPYRGRKSDAEGAIQMLKGKLTKWRPGVKSEMTSYEGTPIEVLTAAGFSAALAFRDNWFFIGSELSLLQETLARYDAKPGAKPGLNTAANFQAATKQASPEADLLIWADGAVLPTEVRKDFPGFSKVKAVVYSAKIEGRLLHDRFFVYTGETVSASAVANRSTALTQPATYAYAAGNLPSMGQVTAIVEWLVDSREELEKALAPKGLKFADVFTTFGPELAIMSSWERGWLFPDVLLTVEVNDKAKARLFAELIVGATGPNEKVTTKEINGATTWTVGDMGPVKPMLAINDRHLMIGLNEDAVKTALTQVASAAPNVATKPGANFPAVVKSVTPANVGMLYIDLKPLYEQLWERTRPFIANEIAGEPDLAKNFDVTKLPKASTVSQHLEPFIVSLSAAEQGWLVESKGPISFLPISIPAFTGTYLFKGNIGQAQIIRAQGDVQMLITQLQFYQVRNGVLPSTVQGLQALIAMPTGQPQPAKWSQLMKEMPLDPWGSVYNYINPGTRSKDGFDVYSIGPDKKPNTSDDIGNW